MPKGPNQKLKLLYLMRYLLRESDEKHPVTVAQMIAELDRLGVSAERKSIYDDLEALRLYGLDIVQERGQTTTYYVGERDFELPELKLLVDSIQSSKFITEKKTLSLIKKLESLASVHDAQLLERQLYVRGRVKSMNESVYYNVDEISGAISRDRAIRFKYYEITPDKQRRYRRGGAFYTVSPYALIWDDENYYMLAWEAESGSLRHYRVDKMAQIAALEQPREGGEAFRALDMSQYSQRVFGMFAGEPQRVKLRFASHLVGAVVDRFGRETMLVGDGDEHFTVTLELVVSPQFFAWLYGFGTEAEILSPPALRREAAERARAIAGLYESEK